MGEEASPLRRSTLVTINAIVAMMFGVICDADAGDPAFRQRAATATFIVSIEGGSTFAGRKHGRGICLDSPCVHVLTNYHVAGLIRPSKVEGVGIQNTKLATGPDDPEGVPVAVFGGIYRFNPQQDLALLTLKRPLPDRFMGAAFADFSPSVGMRVVRYPNSGGAFEGRLVHVGTVRYLDADTRAREMHAVLMTDFDAPAGASGGALCDRDGKVVGLTALRNSSIAISITTISRFILGADPDLWRSIGFDRVATDLEDTDIEELEPTIPEVALSSSGNPHDAIRRLIANARAINERMTHVIAEAEIRRTGPSVDPRAQRYELAVFADGFRFWPIAANGQRASEMTDVPVPEYGITPAAEWDYLLRGLASASVTYSGETLQNGEFAHLFRFEGLSCPFREKRGNGVWSGVVDCSGEVVANESYQPVRIRTAFHFSPSSALSQLQIEIAFNHENLADGGSYMFPVRVSEKAKFKGQLATYTASNTLTRFRHFRAEHLIRSDTAVVDEKAIGASGTPRAASMENFL